MCVCVGCTVCKPELQQTKQKMKEDNEIKRGRSREAHLQQEEHRTMSMQRIHDSAGLSGMETCYTQTSSSVLRQFWFQGV